MRLRRTLGLFALGCATGFASARAADPAPFRLEERVGAETLAFVSLDGFPRGWRDALATTQLGPLLAEPGVEAQLRPLFDLLRSGLARSGVDEAFAAHLGGALGDLDARLSIAWTGFRGDGVPEVSIALDFGSRLSALIDFVRSMAAAPPAGWTSAPLRDPTTGAAGVILASFGANWVVRTVGTTLLVDNEAGFNPLVFDPPTRPVASSPLSSTEAFAEVAGARSRAGVGLFAYVDLARFVARAVADPSSGFGAAFARASGLDALTTAAYVASIAKDGVVESLRVRADRADRGVFRLFRTAPVVGAPSPFAAARSLVHLETSLPLSTAPAAWRAFLHDIDREDEVDFGAAIARIDHVIGASLERDLLPRLIDEQTLSIGRSSGGGVFPDVVLSVPVKDPMTIEAPLEKAVDGLCTYVADRGAGQVTQRTIRVAGRSMHVVEQRGSDFDADWPCSPTWALVGDRLVVTPVPHTMRAVFARLDRAGERAGQPSPAAGAGTGLESARAAGAACVVATGDVFSTVYDTLVPLVETVPSWRAAARRVGFDPVRLPGAEATTGTWSDTTISLRVAADGVTATATSPIGVAPLMFLVAAAWRGYEADESATIDTSNGASGVAEATPVDDPDELTRRMLEHTVAVVREYRRLRGVFPAALDDLVTSEPLLRAIPRDGWGRPVRYRAPTAVRAPAVFSFGKDGLDATDDDVAVEVAEASK